MTTHLPTPEVASSYHASELVRELHGVHHNAMWHTAEIGEALLALRLIRSNARGWYDATAAGREEITGALRAGTLTCEYNCEAGRAG